MENRKGRRKPVDMHVVVRYEGLGLVSGRVRDIGAGGMALNAGPIVIPKDSSVKLHFRLPEGPSATSEVGATVVWARNGNMGLVFHDAPHELTRCLRSAIYGAPALSGRRFRKRFHG